MTVYLQRKVSYAVWGKSDKKIKRRKVVGDGMRKYSYCNICIKNRRFWSYIPPRGAVNLSEHTWLHAR